ncbi:MAG: type II secretion system GspH family protein [Phycisphaerae bacterium]|nr:type II secretion system GspH family protein [Phycisphaerae bacterium]
MPKDGKCGFTLVELLVVMAIISFLLAIIVPAIGRAKDQSRLVICRSNQRGLVLASLAYSGENNSKLPVDRQLHNSHIELVRILSGGGYVQEPRNYYCPSEKSDELKYSDENFDQGNIGYFYYCFTDRPTNGQLSTFFLKKLPWPRLLKDTMRQNTWVFSDSWFSGIPTAHRWYKKGVNYAVLDGSVHMVKSSPKSEFN